jgi:hypothetical protein
VFGGIGRGFRKQNAEKQKAGFFSITSMALLSAFSFLVFFDFFASCKLSLIFGL